MGYVENNLLNDEKIVFKTKKHWIIFLWPALFLIVGIKIILLEKTLTPTATASNPSSSIGGFFMLIGILWFVLALIDFLNNEYAVTDKRIIIKVGMIKRTTLEMNKEKVESILVDQSILGRMFNYGTLIVSGTGSTKQPFKHISDPIQFKKIVQEK
jgi:uncharacterized membrane protein YdbT with pleckstrin-like domain